MSRPTAYRMTFRAPATAEVLTRLQLAVGTLNRWPFFGHGPGDLFIPSFDARRVGALDLEVSVPIEVAPLAAELHPNAFERVDFLTVPPPTAAVTIAPVSERSENNCAFRARAFEGRSGLGDHPAKV